jgi:hypothetical protein
LGAEVATPKPQRRSVREESLARIFKRHLPPPINKMASLVKLKPFCKVFGKMTVVVASMSHVGKKPREATIFCFTSIVQIAKWLLHGFSLEAVFLIRGLTGLL